MLVLSTAWGVWRGLVREVISLAGWVGAFLAANWLAEPLANALPGSISNPELRVIVAFVAIFVVTLTLATLVALMVSKALKASGLARPRPHPWRALRRCARAPDRGCLRHRRGLDFAAAEPHLETVL